MGNHSRDYGSFVLFNTPSAVIWTINLSYGLNQMSNEFYIAAEIANIFVAAGKAINFVVFYCSSEQFRKRFGGIFIFLFVFIYFFILIYFYLFFLRPGDDFLPGICHNNGFYLDIRTSLRSCAQSSMCK